MLRLFADHQVHGGEQLLLSTSNKTVCSYSQAVCGLLGTCRSQSQQLQKTRETVRRPASPLGHLYDGEGIENTLHVLPVTSQRPVPREGVRAVGQVLMVEHLESSNLHGLETVGDLDHVGDTITQLDSKTNLTVVEVVVIVVFGHEPLVDTKDTAGLEHTQDLAVDTRQLRGVDSSLNGVDGIEAVVGEVHLHEVTLYKVQLVRQALLLRIVGSTLNLVVIVVQSSNVAAGELGDLTSRATHTTTDIQHFHALLNADLVGKIVLVTGDRLVERLAVGVTAEVERLTPTILVQVGG